MPNVQLVRLEQSVDKAIAADAEYIQAMAQEDWGRLAAAVIRVVGRTIPTAPPVSDQVQWGGYVAVDAATREVIGSCGFKSPPTDAGSIEIAYHTYPGFESRGYATEMARTLIDLTRRSSEVHCIIAHTLPQTNASTRVLEKVGMGFVGEVIEPDDGHVWRWQMQVGV